MKSYVDHSRFFHFDGTDGANTRKCVQVKFNICNGSGNTRSLVLRFIQTVCFIWQELWVARRPTHLCFQPLSVPSKIILKTRLIVTVTAM